MEILPVVMAAVLDTSPREDLTEKALAPGNGRHHAAVPPTLILGEGRVNLREAHHPDNFTAVHRDAVSLPSTSVRSVSDLTQLLKPARDCSSLWSLSLLSEEKT